MVTITSVAVAEDGTLKLSYRPVPEAPAGLAAPPDGPADLPTQMRDVAIFVDAIPTPVNGQITDIAAIPGVLGIYSHMDTL